MDSSSSATRPIVAGPGEGEALWFLGILATIKASTDSTGGAVAVIEHLAPRGSGSPLHVHSREDEWFYVMEGEVRFQLGNERKTLRTGESVLGPRMDLQGFVGVGEKPGHMISAVTEAGRVGMTAVGDTAAKAQECYDRAERILLSEARSAATPRSLP